MLRADGKKSLCKKLLCLALVLSLTFIPATGLSAAEDDVLYFGALDENIAQNVKTATVEKGVFFVNGAVQAKIDFYSNQAVFMDIHEGTVRFQEYMVSEGDVVKKGDPIARVSVSVDEIEKEEVELNLEAAKNNLEEYISDTSLLLDQYKKAAQTGTERDRKLAELSYERLLATFKAEKEKRESRIDEYTLRLTEIEGLEGREYIYAPVDGIVDFGSGRGFSYKYRTNEVMNYWPAVCYINDPTKVRVEVSGGSDLLRYNMPVKIIQSSGTKTLELTGRVITLKSTASSVNLMANDDIIEVYGDASAFNPGKEVSVRFDKIYVEDALTVPKTAVKSDKKGSYVNVYVNGFSSKRYVVIGGADAMNNWIVSGVNEGDIVILDN